MGLEIGVDVPALNDPRFMGVVTPNGVNDNALLSAAASVGGTSYLKSGTFDLSSTVTWPATDGHLVTSPAVAFTGAGKVDLRNLLPFHSDLFGLDIQRKEFGSAFPAYSDIFMFGRYAYVSSARKAVALYGEGQADYSGANAWGLNCAGLATQTGATAIGAEITALSNATGTTTTALLLGGKGSNLNTTGLQISSGAASNAFQFGIVINADGSKSSVYGSILDAGYTVAERGIDLRNTSFSVAEYDGPSLLMSSTAAAQNSRINIYGSDSGTPGIVARGWGSSPATAINLQLSSVNASIQFFTGGKATTRAFSIANVASATDYIQVSASASGVPIIEPAGSTTNASVLIRGKGTGGGILRDGGGTNRVQTNTTGVGFNGTSPIAKPTLQAALATDGSATNAPIATAINSIRSALINYGLA